MKQIKLDLKKTVHIVVDVQRDYCSSEGVLAKARGFNMEPMVKAAKRIDSFVKATRKSLKTIWVRMEEDPKTIAENLRWAQDDPLTFCKIGTKGYDYFIVRPEPGEKEFHKIHYVLFHNPEVLEYLRKNGIDTIIYSGVLSSRCVYASMVTGSALGFKSIILSDLVENPAELQAEKSEFLKVAGLLFARVMTSEDVLKMIKEQTAKNK